MGICFKYKHSCMNKQVWPLRIPGMPEEIVQNTKRKSCNGTSTNKRRRPLAISENTQKRKFSCNVIFCSFEQ